MTFYGWWGLPSEDMDPFYYWGRRVQVICHNAMEHEEVRLQLIENQWPLTAFEFCIIHHLTSDDVVIHEVEMAANRIAKKNKYTVKNGLAPILSCEGVLFPAKLHTRVALHRAKELIFQ